MWNEKNKKKIMGPQEGSQGPVGSDSAQGPSLGTAQVGTYIFDNQIVA